MISAWVATRKARITLMIPRRVQVVCSGDKEAARLSERDDRKCAQLEQSTGDDGQDRRGRVSEAVD
jgi:hypothetical protein